MKTPKPPKKPPYPITMGRAGIQMIEKFNVYDHVWGICNINRFCGKGDRQVSVGAHSLHCLELARIWQPENTTLQLIALTHDIPEAYYNDSPGFIKSYFGPEYKDVTDDIDNIIFEQLGLYRFDRVAWGADLKKIDENALTIEASYCFDKFEPMHWPPCTLYENQDILDNWTVNTTPKDVYTQIITELTLFGETNENLAKTLAHSLPRFEPGIRYRNLLQR